MIWNLIRHNPFIAAVAILQFCGAFRFYTTGDSLLSILMFLYGLTNIVILFMRG